MRNEKTRKRIPVINNRADIVLIPLLLEVAHESFIITLPLSLVRTAWLSPSEEPDGLFPHLPSIFGFIMAGESTLRNVCPLSRF